MNGARALLGSLVNSGVEICFANPGTSEMHLVAAIGETDKIRSILCLFEGVVTGAADGYWRMKRSPAVTLLHLGPGYANGMANLHNARRAFSGIINIVGDHAEWHLKYDAPLTSDVLGHVDLHSDLVRSSESAQDLGLAGSEVVAYAKKGWGKIATLFVPANHAWEEASSAHVKMESDGVAVVPPSRIKKIAESMNSGKKTGILLGGQALLENTTEIASRISQVGDITLLCETFAARLQRGVGRVSLNRIPYFAEQAIEFLKEFEQIILVGAKSPVGFFAYPEVESLLAPKDCEISTLVKVDEDSMTALAALADFIGAPKKVVRQKPDVSPATGEVLSPSNIGDVIAELLPANSIVSDEGITCGLELYTRTMGAEKHDWLSITGGSIGQGLPVSFGASVACPDRKVVAFQADGSGMYTVQTLWSMAREDTDVTIVLLKNDSYAILNVELARLKAGKPTDKTKSMFDLSNPSIDWVSVAGGLGVPAKRVGSVSQFRSEFGRAMDGKGPFLIEVLVSQDINAGFKR
ncbi:MAG: acetolactate synthase large subunit [Pseudomonadota bacterium]|nr:acetolactate synthase large subunit [Pseudomonadota bacterium]